MNVIITGCSGFLGQHLITTINQSKKKWKLFGIDKVEVTNQLDNFYLLDFIDEVDWKSILTEIKPDIIFHLAGVYHNASIDSMIKINTLQTLSLLDTIQKNNLNPIVVLIGSASQYGYINPKDNPIDETHSQNPILYHGYSKKWQEEIGLMFVKKHSLNVICTRPTNFIGKGIAPTLLPGYLTHLFQSEETEEVIIDISSKTARRDYVDVRDAAQALIKLCETTSCIGEVFNISSSKSISNEKIIELYGKISKRKFKIQESSKKDDLDISLSNEKIKRYTDWKIKHTIEESITWSLS
ncbi:MAG: NAD(P)-dependent oxidoreductase [Asgard group archaeon]|nr:NAD(P)-dependent oxidoreductase [Asgard group archaeon]